MQQTVKIWAGRGAGDLTLHKKALDMGGREAAMGGGGGRAARPVCRGNEPKKTGARTRGQNPLVTIYLPRVLCLCVCVCVCVRVCVCVSQFVSERSAILLVLVIKLTKETRREYAYHCLSLN
jgi:hypothetical protein